MVSATLIVFFATLLLLKYLLELKRKKFPPAPLFHVPFLGHLPFLGSVPSKNLMKWGERYGPIIGVQVGSHPTIVINDSELMQKAFGMASFAGRPDLKFTNHVTGNRKGFAFSDGPKAMELRRFSQRLLKEFGYGSKTMENRIIDLVPNLLEAFEHSLIKPLQVRSAFSICLLSSLWSIVAGKSLDKNDAQLQNLRYNISKAFQMPTLIEQMMVFMNFVPEWFPEFSRFNEKSSGIGEVKKYIKDLIEDHKAIMVDGERRDYVDAYLQKVKNTSDPESPFFSTHDNITYAIQELFVAGMETTSLTLEWLLYYLAKYPVVQRKLQQVIDCVLETQKVITYDDRYKLPYVEAVIQEVLRISSIIPFSLFHSCLKDTEFNGYIIPKGTMVLGNLYAAHHDKNFWGDPEVFRPERFLDSEGKFVKSKHVLAFGSGKRSCIGTHLAQLQLFLYTVSICQHFSFEPSGKLPSEDGIFGISRPVTPFELFISSRACNNNCAKS